MSNSVKRRHFLQALLLGAGVPLIGLNRHVLAGEHEIPHRRLVLVELAGANDGLNTLVPYANDHYHRLRPDIGLSRKDLITLNDSLGLHQQLKPLMPLWERGELAWVQGLGYPKANRSHFKSIALWETAGDGQRAPDSEGWMTHAVEHLLARQINDPHGISLAGNLSVFASETGRWLSTRSVKELLQQSPPSLAGQESEHTALALLQQRLQTLDATLTSLGNKLESTKTDAPLPAFAGGRFGEQLRQVAMMMAAGLDTPVYRVQLQGFDTHQNQPARHDKLMKTLSQSLASFSSALRRMGEWDNTLVMTYSEFGRRAAQNRSNGTDHGTAAPHLLLGGAIAGGLYGSQPNLAELDEGGDPLFTMDYRALYHRMLADGLGAVDAQQGNLAAYADDRLQDLVHSA